MIRKMLFRLLGVNGLVHKAFIEGWEMATDVDSYRCAEQKILPNAMRKLSEDTRTWRSLGEAWANSDVEDEV